MARNKCYPALFLLLVLFGCQSTSPVTTDDNVSDVTQRAVRPGEPAESSRVISKSELIHDDLPPHTEADTQFMQGMIAHHAQALVMTEMVPTRTERQDLLTLAKRIDVSQGSEIKAMQDWLRKRGDSVPMVPGVNTEDEMSANGHAGHDMSAMHGGHGELMPGMLTQDNLDELSAATGDTFYKLFLEYMIGHHEGALTMVADLFSNDGAGQDTDIFVFASDVDIDQRIEIDRMHQMLEKIR